MGLRVLVALCELLALSGASVEGRMLRSVGTFNSSSPSPNSTCLVDGDPSNHCSNDTQCCSGLCNSVLMTCGCSGELPDYAGCTRDLDCCPGLSCQGGKCRRLSADVPATCQGLYAQCSNDADCCDGVCFSPSHQCLCAATGWVCQRDGDCCSGLSCNTEVYYSGGFGASCYPTGCKAAMGNCSADKDCCSGPCHTPSGQCTCAQVGGECSRDADCCVPTMSGYYGMGPQNVTCQAGVCAKSRMGSTSPYPALNSTGCSIETFAGTGSSGNNGASGPATSTMLNGVGGLDASDGMLYIVDTYNYRVLAVDSSGNVNKVAGAGTSGMVAGDEPASSANFYMMSGVAHDVSGRLFVGDGYRVRVFSHTGEGVMSTFAGSLNFGDSGDGGLATSATMEVVHGVAMGPGGDLFIAEGRVIRRVDSSGYISTFANLGFEPDSLAVDAGGNVLVASRATNAVWNVSGTYGIARVAGNGTFGFGGDFGPASEAQLASPSGVAVGANGDIFISDYGNQRVRRVDAAGIITTFAGSGPGANTSYGYTGAAGAPGDTLDKVPATAVPLDYPGAIVVDAAGDVYVAMMGNNVVRKISCTGPSPSPSPGPSPSPSPIPTPSPCPIGCANDSCIADAAGLGGNRCFKCVGQLVVNQTDGTCSCQAGMYASWTGDCVDCPKGSYCPGGAFDGQGSPAMVPCARDMTTLGKRSIGIDDCVPFPLPASPSPAPEYDANVSNNTGEPVPASPSPAPGYGANVSNNTGEPVPASPSPAPGYGANVSNNTGEPAPSPSPTPSTAAYQAPSLISCGGYHTLAIKLDGTVKCWGMDGDQQCKGAGYVDNAVSVCAGGFHSCALKSDGTVVCWGRNDAHQIEVPAGLSNVRVISCGFKHSCAVVDGGSVVCWGSNGDGQTKTNGFSNVMSIGTGYHGTCALQFDGATLQCAGTMDWVGSNPGSRTLPGLKSVSYGNFYFCVLHLNGTVQCFGDNSFHQSSPPSSLTTATGLSTGWYHACALAADGKVTCWGSDSDLVSTTGSQVSNATSIAAGGAHACALLDNGHATCWGRNDYTQCNVPADVFGTPIPGLAPKCLVAGLPSQANATWGACAGAVYGSKCTSTCGTGYQGTHGAATCEAAGWNVTAVAACTLIECSGNSAAGLPNQTHATWAACADALDGTTCTAACDAGYKGTPGTATCGATGWTVTTAAECISIVPSPSPVPPSPSPDPGYGANGYNDTGKGVIDGNVVNTRCPIGCASDSCFADGAGSRGYRCSKCVRHLVVNQTDGTCSCPAGKYASSAGDCVDCEKGSYCPGGAFDGQGSPAKVACGTDLTTLGKRSIGIKDCVNTPGTYFMLGSTDSSTSDNTSTSNSSNSYIPIAVPCPADTFGPGLKKQRLCVPCPSGFTTNGLMAQKTRRACVMPAGYYYKGPGQVAPCPFGSYNPGDITAVSCIDCPAGVTTPTEASASIAACKIVLPGHYPSEFIVNYVNATEKCPQKYYCPGGIPTAAFDVSKPSATAGTTLVQCPAGLFTENIGSTSEDQCLTPPGYQTVNGTTVECPSGQWREQWKPLGVAANCTPCGSGIPSAPMDQFTVYAITPDAAAMPLFVRGSAASCFIVPGQSMVYSPATDSYVASFCDDNSYGVANITYGQAAYPCRNCPAGMITSLTLPNSARYYVSNGYGRGGFMNPMACVTKAGFGYDGRVARKCAAGFWNPAGTYNTCSQCGYGLSTADEAGLQVSAEDCKLAPGFGAYNNTIMPCPVGTYNDALRSDRSTPCTPCAAGSTTATTGASSASQCEICAPGYGPGNGLPCGSTCGGSNGPSYGPAGRQSGSGCEDCPAQTVGFSFDFLSVNQPFAPAVVAREAAEHAGDCLSEFAQVVDGAWFLGGNAALASVANASTFGACVAACKEDANCQYLMYNYDASAAKCFKKVAGTGSDVIAFKAVVAGDASAASKVPANGPSNRAKGLSSGTYTLWKDDARGIGADTSTAGPPTSVKDCLSACDIVPECAGVVMTGMSSADSIPTACKLIKGDATVATFKRGMTKADVARLTLSALFS